MLGEGAQLSGAPHVNFSKGYTRLAYYLII
jgi:hypothetical protein